VVKLICLASCLALDMGSQKR